MIAIPNQLPPLKVGDLVLISYETDWLKECILQAAEEAGHPDWWPAVDVARGIRNYLQNHFTGPAITLAELFDKLSATLKQIGCSSIASHLRVTPPPVSLSLHALAIDTDSKLELLFFQSLHKQLSSFREQGFTSFRFDGLKPCVKHLRSAKQWRKDCQQLASDITAFLCERASDEQPSRSEVTLIISED
ncbi:hypothetical protein [Sulfuriroseicoccus oceanibius]|uniref:Uncharacterized protein n=1 Tax=Sulfuriroseicoccus oceanibius TaxID=2707525 RepID=A0A6B3L8K7_9BACT|nr:hypothetical protein [Sulfuriroseicoccus oceanibius]QQL46159.1 hypothetical protein G3M56_006150 [Sulfuriroseicoccus oceanibius]